MTIIAGIFSSISVFLLIYLIKLITTEYGLPEHSLVFDSPDCKKPRSKGGNYVERR